MPWAASTALPFSALRARRIRQIPLRALLRRIRSHLREVEKMGDVFSKAKRSLIMSAIRSRGNKDTEMKMVAIFRAHRITGWRRHLPLPGRPDFAFRKERVAVFVDGCFWHGCPKHCRMPATNSPYWTKKIQRNRDRNIVANRLLQANGWRIIRIWEHSLREPWKIMPRIRTALNQTINVAKSA